MSVIGLGNSSALFNDAEATENHIQEAVSLSMISLPMASLASPGIANALIIGVRKRGSGKIFGAAAPTNRLVHKHRRRPKTLISGSTKA